MTKDEMIEQLLQQVNSLTATIDAQTQLIAQLNQTIQGLKEQLNKNSKNSSKPPSSDGYKKPAPKSLRKSSGKKVGPKRGFRGMEQCGVLTEFKGIGMHDYWASCWNYPDIQHAVCCAHLLRELTGIAENHPDG